MVGSGGSGRIGFDVVIEREADRAEDALPLSNPRAV